MNKAYLYHDLNPGVMLENIKSGWQVTFYNSAADCALFVVLAVPASNKSNRAAAEEHISQ